MQAGKVKEKVSNKQKAYVIDQDLITSSADSNVAALDDTILLLSREISEDEEFVMKAESQLKSLTSSLTAEEMTAQLSVVFTNFNSFFVRGLIICYFTA